MVKAKRAHQLHEAGQRLSFEDGRQINFREKDREKNLSPQACIAPINSSEFLVFFNSSSAVRHYRL